LPGPAKDAAKRKNIMVALSNNFFMGLIFNGFIKEYRYNYNGKLIRGNQIKQIKIAYSLNLHANP
jgi:hypothetical protein